MVLTKNILMRVLTIFVVLFFTQLRLYSQYSVTCTETDVSCNGFTNGTVTVNVTGGTPNFTYTLYIYNTSNGDWDVLAGPVGSALSTYTFNSLGTGNYYVEAMDAASNNALSNIVTVNQPAALDGGTIGSNQIICSNPGNPASFTNVVSPNGGSGTWTYDWEWSTNSSFSPTNSLGKDSLVCTPPGGLSVTTYYRRKATRGSCGTVYSDNYITVTVNTPPTSGGTIAPATQSVCSGTLPSAFTSTVDASGGTSPSYVWLYSTNSSNPLSGTWNTIASSNSNTLTYSAPITVQTYFVRSYFNSCGTVYSNVATVNVYGTSNPGVVASSVTQACANAAIPLFTSTSAASGGESAPVYQWQTNASGSWANIAGATSTTYQTPALTQTTSFRRRAFLGCDSVYSNVLTINISNISTPVITVTPPGLSCFNSTNAQFTVAVSGGIAPYTYVWEQSPSESPLGPWIVVGGNSNTLSNIGQGLYQVIVSDVVGCTPVSKSILFVYGAPGMGPFIPADVAVPTASAQNQCTGNTVANLIATPPNGCIVQWFTAATGGVALGAGTLLATGTYYAGSENTTSGCTSSLRTSVAVTVVPLPTANAGASPGAICQGGTTGALNGTVGGSATGGTWSTPAGGTFTPNATTLNATWTPPAAYTGTATLTLTSSGGGCGTAISTTTVLVNPSATISLTSAAGTNAQSLCINTAITNITYSVGGGGTGAGVTGLPAGVNGNYNAGVFTISGTPTVSGTFNYTVTTTGTCTQATANGTITVNPNATISLTSAAGTNAQSLCINTAITNITYSVGGGGTGAGVTGLPAGVNGNYNAGVFTISGTPTVSGTFNYTVTTTGTCTQATANGSITVTQAATASAGASPGAICQGGTTAALNGTVGGSATGGTWSTPAGGTFTPNATTLNATWTPPAAYTGTATLTLTSSGGCGVATSTTTVLVNPNATISLTSAAGTNAQSLCVNTAITNITYSVGGGGTGAGVTGLPAGVNGNYNAGVFTISGTPTVSGTFNYTVTTTGTCTQATANGSITVTQAATASAGASPGAICQGGTTGALNGTVGGSATGGTWSTPAGGTFTPNATTLNATWTPPAAYTGTATLTLTSSGGCGVATSTTTVLVNPSATISLTSAAGTNAQSLCVNTAITNITYSVGGGGTGAGVTGLPAGVSGNYNAGVFTISGTPTVSGTFNYTVTTTGTCTQATANGTITVNPNATINLTSAAGTNAQTLCVNTAITNITYSIGGSGTGAGVTGLPAGVNGNYNAGVFTISGTPTVSGTFNYTVTTTGTCTQATANGSITVTQAATASAGASPGAICQGGTTGALNGTVGGSATGGTWSTPAGGTFTPNATTLNATWTPPAAYTGTATLTLTSSGGCGVATSTTTVLVNPNATISLTSAAGTNAQSLCVNTAITNITYSVGGGGTGAGVTGLPAGVNGNYNAGVFTISGTPTVSGTFNYTVTTTGTCTQATANGSITVTQAATASAGASPGAICQGGTTGALNGTVGGSATGGTWSTPAGGTFTPNATTLNATWTPPAAYTGTATLTLTSSGGCGVATSTTTVLVNPNATISLTSGAGTNAQSLCVNTAITKITYSVGGGGTGAGVTGLPAGVNGNYNAGVFTISGTPTVSGTFNYTVTTTGTCTQATVNGTITVNPAATISLTSAAGTNAQTLCVNTAITNITYSVGGGGTGAGVTGLPAGVSGNYNAGVFTISGTPTVSGTFNYTVTTTGTCTQATANGTITVNPNATINLTSAAGTNAQTLCVNTAITNITYSIGGSGTGAGVTGLPAGVNGNYNAGVFTISGTPTVSGTFNYTVTTTGSCAQATANGSITVTQAATANAGAALAAICQGGTTAALGGSVGGSATGGTWSTPAGGTFTPNATTLNATWTPPAAYTGTATLTLTSSGGCGVATSSKNQQVNPNATISLTSAAGTNNQTLCINTAITNITYSVGGGGTGAGATGLPAGVTGSYNAGVFTITGTPTVSGTFNYTVTTTGTCTQATANGKITVNPNATITLTSAAGTNAQTICINTPITKITYSVGGGGTGAGVAGLPAGVNGSYNAGVFTITGTPTVSGTFNYTVTTTGTCGQATANGSVTVTAAATASAGASPGAICQGGTTGALNGTVGGSATGGTWSAPAGGTFTPNATTLNATWTPPAAYSGTATLTLTSVGGCGVATSNTTVTVNPNATIKLTSAAGTNAQTLCINTVLTVITYSVGGGGTGAGVTGLPAGVTGNYNAGVFTISGTPTVSGTFNYTVTTIGTCTQASAVGTITVNPNATVSLTSAVGTDGQTLCVSNVLTDITYSVGGGGTGAGVVGLPSGVTGSYNAGVFTISGTPTASGVFNYKVTSTGTCQQASANGTITVNANIKVSAGKNDSICHNDNLVITDATVSNYSSLLWTTSGDGTFSNDTILNPVYFPGTNDRLTGSAVLTLTASSLTCPSVFSTKTLTITPLLLATIGSLTPYHIGAGTIITVGIDVINRQELSSLGFSLVAPDGTVVVLNTNTFSCFSFGSTADVVFTTKLPSTQTYNMCVAPYFGNNLSGTFGATGDWTQLYGKDPANGAWRVEVTDCDNGFLPGNIANAFIEFKDVDSHGDSVTVSYDSGNINNPINQSDDAFTCAPTDYIVPIGLKTKCANCGPGSGATAVLTKAGGTAPYSKGLWYNKLAPATVVATGDTVELCAGNYFALVTDALGCVDTAFASVTSPEPIIIDSIKFSNGDTLKCFNDTTSIQVFISGGTGIKEYTIKSITKNSGESLSGLSAGIYPLHIFDGNGCTKDTTITIVQPAKFFADSLRVVNIACNLANNGLISLKGHSGTTPYNFVLENNGVATGVPVVSSDSAVFNGLAASNNYSVIATDKNGCNADTFKNIMITQPFPLAVNNIDTSNYICFGQNNGFIDFINTSGGKRPYRYSVNGGINWQQDSSFTALAPGPYSLVVRDTNNCSAVFPAIILKGANKLVIDSTVENNVSVCYNNPIGTIKIYASGGNGILYFSIDTMAYQVDSTFTGLIEGIYTTHVKDTLTSCTVTGTAVISGPPPVVLDSAVTVNAHGAVPGSCIVYAQGGSGRLQNSLNGINYQTNDSFLNLAVGKYYVYVHDSLGCFAPLDSVYISNLSVTVTQTNVLCKGASTGTITLTVAGPGTYKYSDNGGKTFQDSGEFVKLPAGNYLTEVVDTTGAKFFQAVTIDQPDTALKIFSLIPSSPTCYGGNNGVLSVVASGMAPLQYSLNGGAYGPGFEFSNLTAGNYLVSVEDTNGCKKTSATILTGPSPISITASITNVMGLVRGSIKVVTVTGGTPPYQFSIDGGTTWQSDSTFSNLNGGIYTLTTEDASCSHDTTLVIASGDTLNVIPVVTNIKCFGDSTGIISLTMGDTHYTNPLLFLIQGPDTIETSGNDSWTSPDLPGGTYLVTVEDATGAEYQHVIIIQEPAPLTVNGTVVNTSCNFASVNQTFGSITLVVQGGTTPYNYLWNNGLTLPSLTGLSTGYDTVTVTDANSCTVKEAFTVNANDTLIASAGKPATICQGSPYQLNASGSPGDSWSWTPITGLSSSVIQNPVLTTDKGGVYQVTLTDAKGCVDTASVTISVYPQFNLRVGVETSKGFTLTSNIYVDLNKAVQLEALPDSFSSYQWVPSTYLDNPTSRTPVATFTGKDGNDSIYKIIATDANGCVQEDSIIILVRSHGLIPTGIYPGSAIREDQVWWLEMGPAYPNILVKVYNRWGELVYISTGYDNVTKVFDGKVNGRYLPVGTYYYVIDFKDGTTPETGSVTIVSAGK